MTTDADLRANAVAASPGEWASGGDEVYAVEPYAEVARIYEGDSAKQQDANADHIAAWSPPRAIIALDGIAVLRALTDVDNILEWQDEQGGCNFYCGSTGKLGREKHAKDYPLIVGRQVLASWDALNAKESV